MRKNILLLITALSVYTGRTTAQVTEDFSDSNFTANPAWTANTTDWIINPSLQLQSNNTVTNSSFYLSTISTLASNAQWEFYVQLSFNTSSANYTDVFLTASDSDLTATATCGYFVRIGGALDEICLYKKTGAVITKIIDGADATTGSSNNTVRIKVTRNGANEWTLYRDLTGRTNFFNEGSVTDNTFTVSSFFGILVKQSTASFARHHFFDDISIQHFVPDITAPVILSATALSTTGVDVLFNEAIDITSAQAAANYTVNNSEAALGAAVDITNNALVHLIFSPGFSNGSTNTLTVNSVQDLSGNSLNNATASFSFYIPRQYDVVIDEIMADSVPQVALPKKEWIELKNLAAFPINVNGWRIGDDGGESGALPEFILQPDSFVIICTGSAAAAMSAYGKVLSPPGFPSLGNDGELLYLKDGNNNFIHSVNYSIDWYRNEIKKDGGWSLEMIDPHNSCAGGSNWMASKDESGGTPGRKNSADAINADEAAPKLLRAYAKDSLNIVLIFDGPVNSASASVTTGYMVSDDIGIPASATALPPLFDRVKLIFASPLARNKTYTVIASAISDCTGNAIGSSRTAKVGLSEAPDSFDIVINEILFNPPANGSDYAEIYNRSKKIIDLKELYIANRNTYGIISSIEQLTTECRLLFPGDFIVITSDADWVKNTFITKNPEAFLIVPSMPSYNDDAGDVIIASAQHPVMDELKYTDKWHFKLLDNREGVALERIDYNAPTQLQDNWHSAASSINYGTPTYKNSQFRLNDAVQGEIDVSPAIVSPDNDGQDDFATIGFHFPDAGYVASITIFDAIGRPVRYLLHNALTGTNGSFHWDGLGEKNQPLAAGIYIIFTEVFNLDGKKKQFKTPVVLARRN